MSRIDINGDIELRPSYLIKTVGNVDHANNVYNVIELVHDLPVGSVAQIAEQVGFGIKNLLRAPSWHDGSGYWSAGNHTNDGEFDIAGDVLRINGVDDSGPMAGIWFPPAETGGMAAGGLLKFDDGAGNDITFRMNDPVGQFGQAVYTVRITELFRTGNPDLTQGIWHLTSHAPVVVPEWYDLAGNQVLDATWMTPTVGMIVHKEAAGVIREMRVAPLTLLTSSSGKLIGEILMWTKPSVPPGFLMCDGSQYDTSIYPKLFAVLGVNTTPDLVDQFVGGSDATHPVLTRQQWQTAKPKAAHSVATNGAHTHTANTVGDHEHPSNSYKAKNAGAGGQAAVILNSSGTYWGGTNWTGPARVITDGQHNHGTSSTSSTHNHSVAASQFDSETAPKHVFLHYIIRAA